MHSGGAAKKWYAQGEIARGEVDWPLDLQRVVDVWIFYAPGLATIHTPRILIVPGTFLIDGVALGTIVLVVPLIEANENLISPRPDAVIGGPPPKPPSTRTPTTSLPFDSFMTNRSSSSTLISGKELSQVCCQRGGTETGQVYDAGSWALAHGSDRRIPHPKPQNRIFHCMRWNSMDGGIRTDEFSPKTVYHQLLRTKTWR